MLTEGQRQEVAELVRAVEARTSGEVAVVWSRRADDYAFVRGVWSVALAAVLVAELALHGIRAVWLPGLTALVAGALYLLLGLGPILRRIVPDAVQNERVHRQAQAAFLEFGVTETSSRGGVLLFLSELEHRVEILADCGIAERVEAGVWQSVVDDLISALRARQPMSGVAQALERIGAVLEAEFPPGDARRNELDDAPRQF